MGNTAQNFTVPADVEDDCNTSDVLPLLLSHTEVDLAMKYHYSIVASTVLVIKNTANNRKLQGTLLRS